MIVTPCTMVKNFHLKLRQLNIALLFQKITETNGLHYTWDNLHLNSLLLQKIHLFSTSSKYLYIPTISFTQCPTKQHIALQYKANFIKFYKQKLTSGSPPFSLTTLAPTSAKLRSNSCISSCNSTIHTWFVSPSTRNQDNSKTKFVIKWYNNFSIHKKTLQKLKFPD